MQIGSYNARVTRLAFNDLVTQSGVVGDDDFKTRQTSVASMSVTVSGGAAFIIGEEIYGQGVYHVLQEETNLVVPVPTNLGSKTRKDVLYVRVKDSSISGSNDVASIELSIGTEGSSLLPTLPANSVPIAIITVAAGATSITNANISDARIFAQYNEFMLGQQFQLRPTEWTEIPLSGYWSNYYEVNGPPEQNFAYRVFPGNRVEFRGLIKYKGPATTLGMSGVTVTTLPADAVPVGRVIFPAIMRYTQTSTAGQSAGPAHTHTARKVNSTGRFDIIPQTRLLQFTSNGEHSHNLYSTADYWISFDGIWVGI